MTRPACKAPFFVIQELDMKRYLLFALLLSGGCRTIEQTEIPVTLFPKAMVEPLQAAYVAQEADAVACVEALRETAEPMLQLEAMYVTEKSIVPPSGDKRDYMSLSPYWWPDPAKADGLPYIRRDGERNPEVYNYPERENTKRLGESVRLLSLLYCLTNEEVYAEKACALVRAWFLDPNEGMHPNMNFAQGVPGRAAGRGAGIIDARRFSYAVSVVPLLRGSRHWSDADEQALRAWSEAFLEWLETSELGQKELYAKNNHGLWYDATRLMHLRFFGDEQRIAEVVESSLLPRLDAQIAADGSLPKELERTLSLHYSTFALEAVAAAASLSDGLGKKIWAYRTEDGRSLEAVIDYLLPYYLNPESWPYTQIKPFDTIRGVRLLLTAGTALGRADWLDAARSLLAQQTKADLWLAFCLEQ